MIGCGKTEDDVIKADHKRILHDFPEVGDMTNK